MADIQGTVDKINAEIPQRAATQQELDQLFDRVAVQFRASHATQLVVTMTADPDFAVLIADRLATKPAPPPAPKGPGSLMRGVGMHAAFMLGMSVAAVLSIPLQDEMGEEVRKGIFALLNALYIAAFYFVALRKY